MSLELWSSTQSYFDLTFNYVALPVRRCIAQSKGRRLTCLREDSQRFSMRANYFYCLIIHKRIYIIYIKRELYSY